MEYEDEGDSSEEIIRIETRRKKVIPIRKSERTKKKPTNYREEFEEAEENLEELVEEEEEEEEEEYDSLEEYPSKKKNVTKKSIPIQLELIKNNWKNSKNLTIEKILCRRNKEEKSFDESNQMKLLENNVENNNQNLTEDFEYLIKWKDLSYIHCSWISKKLILMHKQGKQRISTFEKKQIFLQNLEEPFNPDFILVERIISKSEFVEDGENIVKYLVKWESLPYNNCTWERADVINVKSIIKIKKLFFHSFSFSG